MKRLLLLMATLLMPLFFGGCSPQGREASEVRGSEPATPYVYAAKAVGQGQPVMFEFGKGSCKACKEMGELIFRLKKSRPHYRLFYIDVSRDRKAAAENGIRMIPTQLFFDGEGREVYRHVGGFTTDGFMQTLQKYGFDAK
ncbi:thioredoxin family protein [Sulfurimonas sp. HSL3-7]|uniref:thioredoxin family protein n=1 Tax=Sulfonitrofixus jiaomeiensis TaxID=3131938 RepID=UPI0031F91299